MVCTIRRVVGFRRIQNSNPRERIEKPLPTLVNRRYDIGSVQVATHEIVLKCLPGGLPESVSEAAYLQPDFHSNTVVADVFHRLHIIEKLVRIDRIRDEYAGFSSQPEIQDCRISYR